MIIDTVQMYCINSSEFIRYSCAIYRAQHTLRTSSAWLTTEANVQILIICKIGQLILQTIVTNEVLGQR